jgi:hypothetical protein
MSNDLDPTDFDAVIGYYNIGNLDLQQEIWDRAITPERFAHAALMAEDSRPGGSVGSHFHRNIRSRHGFVKVSK